mgnify:FL=1
MTLVERSQPTVMQIPVPASETAAILAVIERAARDPSVDIDKLKELLVIRAQIEEQGAKRAFATAMTQAQTEMRAVAADATNPQTKSKYASYFALDKALRPLYTKHGFSLSFNTGKADVSEYVRVICDVSHDDGRTKEYHIDMPADGKGAKGGDVMTKTHATGSAVSYGMRYLLKMIFNIAVGDDDGNAASGETVTQAQADAIKCLIAEVAVDLPKFLKYFKIENIEDLPAKQYQRAVDAIEGKRKK